MPENHGAAAAAAEPEAAKQKEKTAGGAEVMQAPAVPPWPHQLADGDEAERAADAEKAALLAVSGCPR